MEKANDQMKEKHIDKIFKKYVSNETNFQK